MLSNHSIQCIPAGRKTGSVRTAIAIALIALYTVLGAGDALAYIDPNTGGYIFQLFFPVISVIAFVYLFLKRQVKLFFSKIFHFFKSLIDKVSASREVSQDDINKGSE